MHPAVRSRALTTLAAHRVNPLHVKKLEKLWAAIVGGLPVAAPSCPSGAAAAPAPPPLARPPPSSSVDPEMDTATFVAALKARAAADRAARAAVEQQHTAAPAPAFTDTALPSSLPALESVPVGDLPLADVPTAGVPGTQRPGRQGGGGCWRGTASGRSGEC